jgi:hypothetical protein
MAPLLLMRRRRWTPGGDFGYSRSKSVACLLGKSHRALANEADPSWNMRSGFGIGSPLQEVEIPAFLRLDRVIADPSSELGDEFPR